MKNKKLLLKKKSLVKDSDLIFITDNDSTFKLDKSIKIMDLNFEVEVLDEIQDNFQFNIRLTNNLEMSDFFQLVVTFLSNEKQKVFKFSFLQVIGNNISMMDFKDLYVKYIFFDSNLNFDLKLNIKQL